MNRKTKSEYLKQKLMDAQDGLLSNEELQHLKEVVLIHDPALWEDHQWIMVQKGKGGVLTELADMRTVQPDEEAIRRFHIRRELENREEADLEQLVWSLFRRYVLTIGVLLIVLLAGLELGSSETNDFDGRDQLVIFLGWDSGEFPELDHWLYEDLREDLGYDLTE